MFSEKQMERMFEFITLAMSVLDITKLGGLPKIPFDDAYFWAEFGNFRVQTQDQQLSLTFYVQAFSILKDLSEFLFGFLTLPVLASGNGSRVKVGEGRRVSSK